jgi:hypothetical protein
MRQDPFKEDLKKTAKSTEAKLAKLLSERASHAQEIARLDKEIARAKKYLLGTIQMIEGTSKVQLPANLAKSLAKQDQAGLKEMCLEILKAAYEALTPSEVIKELRDRGFPVDEYHKPLAVVKITLKRLVKDEQAKEEPKDGKAAYKWNPTGTIQLDFPELDKIRERK